MSRRASPVRFLLLALIALVTLGGCSCDARSYCDRPLRCDDGGPNEPEAGLDAASDAKQDLQSGTSEATIPDASQPPVADAAGGSILPDAAVEASTPMSTDASSEAAASDSSVNDLDAGASDASGPACSSSECDNCPVGYTGDSLTGCAPSLLGLTLSHGRVVPEFVPGLDVYDVVVPVFVEAVGVAPTVPEDATVAIRGASITTGDSWTTPALELGLNEFSLSIEQPGRPSAAVTLRITRGAEAIAYLKAFNTGENDTFGTAVALSADGTTLAVGALGESSDATGVGADEGSDEAAYAGAVYVFTRGLNDGTGWSQQAYLKASNTDAHDAFGSSLTLSADGNTLAVGAPGEDSDSSGTSAAAQNSNEASNAGAVYIFERSGSGWSQRQYVKASNPGQSDEFGNSLSLSADGNTLAVGALHEASDAAHGDDSDQTNDDAAGAGAVYVFVRDESGWLQQAYVKASNTGSADEFGSSVALSADGNTLAVGAAGEDSNAIGTAGGGQGNNAALNAGAAYLFVRSGGDWSQQAYVKASNTGEGDSFGKSVALSANGNTLAVGSRDEDSNAAAIELNEDAANAGAVYVFTRSGSDWSQEGYIKASNTGVNDYFGISVSITADGNTLAVGAPGESGSSMGPLGADQTSDDAPRAGAGYVFVRSNGSWRQHAYIKASNTGTGDSFGNSVAIASDGNTLAVGAYYEASNASGTSGSGQNNDEASKAGAAYVYR